MLAVSYANSRRRGEPAVFHFRGSANPDGGDAFLTPLDVGVCRGAVRQGEAVGGKQDAVVPALVVNQALVDGEHRRRHRASGAAAGVGRTAGAKPTLHRGRRPGLHPGTVIGMPQKKAGLHVTGFEANASGRGGDEARPPRFRVVKGRSEGERRREGSVRDHEVP